VRFLGKFAVWSLLALTGSATLAHAQDKTALRVYFADVEGGQSTLFVTPEGESLLIDTGSAGHDGRDAGRIVAMCKLAGVTKIDNLLITHFDGDHVGGVPELAALIPIGRFIDHGPTRDPGTQRGWDAYQRVVATGTHQHLIVKPGDMLPIKGMQVEVVSADGAEIDKPLAAGGAGKNNPACAKTPTKELENSENDRSVGMMMTFGKLRILDLGDLTWAQERPLMCPLDKLGKVDVYVASHHGLPRSGSEALVDGIAPRVTIIENSGIKGAAPETWDIIAKSPRKSVIWQVHTAEGNDAAHNVPDARIANLKGPDSGYPLEMSARKDGSFAVTNPRTGQTVQYGAQ
jgi:competence protein ComEC